MAEGVPETYEELVAVLDALPILVREKRRRLGLSLRAASRVSGVHFSQITRCEHGENLQLTTARGLLLWLGEK